VGTRAAEEEVDKGGGGTEDEPGDVVKGGMGREGRVVDGGEAVAEEDGTAAVGGAVEDNVGDVDSVVRFLVKEDACAPRSGKLSAGPPGCRTTVVLTDAGHLGTRAIL
jgi:hypothetical protein